MSIQVTGLATNSSFVLARVLFEEGMFGLEPRNRLQSDANGNLSSTEPTNADRLPGVDGVHRDGPVFGRMVAVSG